MGCKRLPLLRFLLIVSAVTAAASKGEDSPGFVAELPANESVVLQIVQDIADDAIIRGTYVYEKEQTLSGAAPAKSSPYFGTWQGPGHAFYKVLKGAVAPRHFSSSGDIGTITVRYVVEPVNGSHTRVRIDAVFIENGRRRVDASDGSVETAEFKAIHDKFEKLQLAEQEAAAASAKREKEELAKHLLLQERDDETSRLTAAQNSVAALQERVNNLRRQTQMRVIGSGGELLSAPFHSAAVLQTLPAHSELLIVIVTPYWYGVETPAGQHGWVHRRELEPLR